MDLGKNGKGKREKAAREKETKGRAKTESRRKSSTY